MKTQMLHSNPAGRFSTRMHLLLVAGSRFLVAAAMAQALTAEESTSEARNSVTLSLGTASVSGDKAAFQKRARTDGDFYGGIEALEVIQDLDDETTLTLTGHALPGLDDYGFNLKAERQGLGYIEAGFKQFRTWYDATGGSLQGANMLASNVYGVFDDERSIDRGELFLEAGLRKENLPEVTFRYRHLYREGQKDSLCWGDSRTNTGWGNPGGSNVAFKMMPALWDIDESVDIFEIEAEHTLGITDVGGGMVYERYEIDNTRTTPRWSGAAMNSVAQREVNESDLYAAHAYSVTRFSDEAWLSFAAAYSTLNSDIDGGTRSFTYGGANLPGSRDYSYDQLSGGTIAKQFVTNMNFMWMPTPDLQITPSLRYENESVDTLSSFRAYNTTAFSGGVAWRGMQSLGSTTDMDSITTALDLRYTGVENFVFFANAMVGRESEDLMRVDRVLPGEFLGSDVEIDEAKILAGCNWYARPNLSFSLQGFRETRDQALDHAAGNQTKVAAGDNGAANNFRPIMTGHTLDLNDLNVRMTWRPVSTLALVTRYDYQHGEYTNQGISWTPPGAPVIYPTIESGDIVTHILSQTATWNAREDLYVQGSVGIANSETSTPQRTTGDSQNDFIVANLTVGYALDAKTEVTAGYNYYVAENYSNSVGLNGAATMGYGFNTEEHVLSLMVARQLTENMSLNIRYAFMTSNTTAPDQTGGYNDFDAHMVSSGLQVRF